MVKGGSKRVLDGVRNTCCLSFLAGVLVCEFLFFCIIFRYLECVGLGVIVGLLVCEYIFVYFIFLYLECVDLRYLAGLLVYEGFIYILCLGMHSIAHNINKIF